MYSSIHRRRLLQTGLATGIAALMPTEASAASRRNPSAGFRYCLNTSTLRGQKLPLPELVDIAGKAGYDAIEPWINEIDAYVQSGGSLSDLKKRIEDRGLTVESAIGFPEWIVDDDDRRRKGMEEARRGMDLVRQIGGKRIAAPPVGATDRDDLSLNAAADRYRALLELGDEIGVVPQVELWGFSKSLHRLGEVAYVAIESGHPKACVLPDVYHIYKGGSAVENLKLLSGAAFEVLHVNDYPAEPTRDKLNDGHRVYPGDGVAPYDVLIRDLKRIGFNGHLSLELFNREYWAQDALKVAKTGLEKMRAVVNKA